MTMYTLCGTRIPETFTERVWLIVSGIVEIAFGLGIALFWFALLCGAFGIYLR
jgi:hypothetical protein